MNLPKMIADLQAERDRLDEAILALERLSTSNAKRRGRPPGRLKDPIGAATNHATEPDSVVPSDSGALPN